MLIPNKYTNITYSVVWISYQIIKILKNDNIQKYNDLFNKVIYLLWDEVKENFLVSLCFLYMTWKIIYYKDSDIIELVLI